MYADDLSFQDMFEIFGHWLLLNLYVVLSRLYDKVSFVKGFLLEHLRLRRFFEKIATDSGLLVM